MSPYQAIDTVRNPWGVNPDHRRQAELELCSRLEEALKKIELLEAQQCPSRVFEMLAHRLEGALEDNAELQDKLDAKQEITTSLGATPQDTSIETGFDGDGYLFCKGRRG